MGHDGGEIVELRAPAERLPDAVGLRHDLRGIARPPGAVSTRKSTPDTRLTVSITSRTEKPWP
jgi:hypothetical protein